MSRVVRVEVVSDAAMVEPRRTEWDDLAVAAGRPFSAPAWMLAWWRHAAPAGALLRIGFALEGDRLIGVAPLFVDRAYGGLARYRILAATRSYRAEPVATRGREHDVARAVAEALASADPAPDLLAFELAAQESPWVPAVVDGWPGGRRPWMHREKSDVAPALAMDGPHSGFDAWLSSRSRNFRQQMRRARKKLEEDGATFRLAGAEELPRALSAFERLHRERWEPRGGSRVLDGGVMAMLREAGSDLVGAGRFRLWSIEIGDTVVSSHLFLAAGGEVAYWLGGFDERWSAQHPAQVSLMAALDHAWKEGDRTFDLGWGAQPYKYRFADHDRELEWWTVVPRGRQYLRARAALMPKHAARAIHRRLPDPAKDRLRRLLRSRPTWLR